MRILMMTNTFTPILGGLERSIQSFADYFRNKGHHVQIVAPEFENMPRDEVDVVRIPALRKVLNTDYSVNVPIPGILSDTLERFQPDIIHSHHPFLVGDLALRLCGQHNLPLFFTYHTMYEWYTDLFGLDHEAFDHFIVQLAAGYANLSDHVIVPSKSVKQVLMKRKVETPMTVVPTGIDVEHLKQGNGPVMRQAWDIPANAFLIGHVGRLSPEKNLLFLSRVLAAFLKSNKNAYGIIVGEGPSQQSMRQIMQRNGVESNVRFTGALKGADLVNAYHAMDVFIFTSKSETQGLVVAEAMAASVPVIALDAPGVREIVVNERNGILLSKEDESQFYDAIRSFSELKPPALRTFNNECRKTAVKFSVEKCALRTLETYDQVYRSKRRKSQSQRDSEWRKLWGRLKTEWKLLENVTKAAQAAVKEPNQGKP